jgi:serine/threonine protein kinase/tetratricopeptide (TPR) repeat protein
MKAFSPGLSDSIASVLADPRPCPHCESSSHIAGGLCVGCLLEAGLDPADDCESGELSGLLAEINLPDQNWRLGNYEILEEIGRGGMGVIYRARQRHSRRIVAVKRVLSYHADSHETLARFQREAQAAASLDHPNILPIYEVSESDDGLPFFSMKFAPGGTLQQVAPALRDDPRQSVALVAKIARALQYAHSRGILHRDLKPGNILLDGRGEPLISDFGLAKWLDTTSDLTRTLTIFGTPGYIAPEQANSSAAELKPTADIYSLGALLFDLLAGRPPFLGSHALSVIRQSFECPAPKLRTLSKAADRDLETICSRCLERDPNARYRSAHDLAEDLERWLEGRPIKARPVLAPAKVWRWAKRNRAMAALGAVALLVSLAAITWNLQNRSLSHAVMERDAASRSVAVLPFLNLDSARSDQDVSNALVTVLQPMVSAISPSEFRRAEAAPAEWSGIGTEEEIRQVARQSHSATVLSGTIREIQGKRRIAMRLVRENGSDVLATWQFDTTKVAQLSATLLSATLRQGHIAEAFSEALNGNNRQVPNGVSKTLDATARTYLQTGRDLLDRRTLTDIDRAIACFNSAIAIAPDSAEAYSYLALAFMGRNFVATDAVNLTHALEAARHAIALAPSDAMAQRSLAAVYTAGGDYAEGLEHALQSIEIAQQPTEKAFGQIGYTWRMLGRPEKAIAWLKKAKQTERLPGDYDILIGDCWTFLGADDKAEAAYEAGFTFRPDLPDGWIGRCYLKLAQGRLEDSRQCFQERASEFRQHINVRQMEATIEFFAGHFDQAKQLYQALYQSDPRGTGEHQYGGISYESALARLYRDEPGDKYNGLISSCEASVAKQLKEKPHDAEVLYAAAATSAIRGDSTAALEFLTAAMDAGWNDWRLPQLDPRFDGVRDLPRFAEILGRRRDQLRTLYAQNVSFLTAQR